MLLIFIFSLKTQWQQWAMIGFKFPFQNKSVFIKSNLIVKLKIQLTQQMKNNVQVKVQINSVLDINYKCQHRLNFHFRNEV